MTKEENKKIFEFLLENAWYFDNMNRYYFQDKKTGTCLDDISFSVRTMLLIDLPLEKQPIYRKFLNIMHNPNFIIREKTCVTRATCIKGSIVEHFEKEKFMERQIGYALKEESKKRIFPNKTKSLQDLKEFTNLLEEYKIKIDGKNEEEIIEMIKLNYDVIFELNNPTFEQEKAAVYHDFKNRVVRYDSFDTEYDYVSKKYADELKQRGINSFEDEAITDDLLIEIMDSKPVCAAKILKDEVSRNVAIKALTVFPELLNWSNWWAGNKKNLLLNPIVYQLINEDLNQSHHIYPSPLYINILEANLGLLTKEVEGYGRIGSEEDYNQTVFLLSRLCADKNLDVQRSYIAENFPAQKIKNISENK